MTEDRGFHGPEEALMNAEKLGRIERRVLEAPGDIEHYADCEFTLHGHSCSCAKIDSYYRSMHAEQRRDETEDR